jgi:hypothetical protein
MRWYCRKLGQGYDAYVVAAEVKSKLWHRVRVGQGVDLSEAFELDETQRQRKFDRIYRAPITNAPESRFRAPFCALLSRCMPDGSGTVVSGHSAHSI